MRIATMGTLVYLDDPAEIKKVFAGSPSVYHAGEANSMLGGLLGDSSVLVIDDDVHRERRRQMLPAFHRDAVARQTAVMAEIAAANIATWPVDTEFPVAPKMSEITLEVILRTVIGASDPARLTALREVMPKLLNVTPVGIAGDRKPDPAAARAVARTAPQHGRGRPPAVCRNRRPPSRSRPCDPHRRAGDAGPCRRTRTAARMTDRELRDQLITLLVAGHDTTATGLSWALERLTRHPAMLRQSGARRRSKRGRRSRRATSSSMRSPRRRCGSVRSSSTSAASLKEPVELAGYRLPAGVMVAPGIGLVHSSSAQYPDPDRFDPDRMVGGHTGTHHVAAVRRRQPPLPRRDVRDGRDAGRAA